MKKLLLVTFSLLLAVNAFASPIKLKAGHPTRYTVQPGDTLWGIAGRFLDDPLDWPELLCDNPQIANPSMIYPGQVLVLSLVNGRPHLAVETGGTVKLSPQVRVEPLDNAIPAIPLDNIAPFLDATRVVAPGELEQAPYIVAHGGEHVVVGAGDQIYVEGMSPQDNTDHFLIYRAGAPYRSPQTNAILGYEALHIGNVQKLRSGNPATFMVTSTKREVMVGDRLLPIDDFDLNETFQPRVPSERIEGQIISVIDGVTQIGSNQVVVIDRGSDDCLAVGDLLLIYQAGDLIKNPVPNVQPVKIKLPDEKAGVMIVFRTFAKVSYGLILHATQPIHLLDMVKSPVV